VINERINEFYILKLCLQRLSRTTRSIHRFRFLCRCCTCSRGRIKNMTLSLCKFLDLSFQLEVFIAGSFVPPFYSSTAFTPSKCVSVTFQVYGLHYQRNCNFIVFVKGCDVWMNGRVICGNHS
jgi:hypothetical protein